MLRLILLLVSAFVLATGLGWLADRPGNLVVNWEGYELETSVFRAVVILVLLVGLLVFLWSVLRQVWLTPAVLGSYFNRRRQKRGLEALSSGMIALGAGDKTLATRYAIQARKTMPNEPLTHLLRAQAARLAGDNMTARRIFEAMLSSPDTEQLGLRGLFLEAEAEGAIDAARQFAERALALNPALGWPVESVFAMQCKDEDWSGALDTLAVARKHGHIEKASADRRRAVLLAAQAQALEENDPHKALTIAIEAHGLAKDLVPAAAIAGRLLASRGNTPRATKLIQTTWRRSPHPDLAVAYAYARLGDSPRDRLQRVKQLTLLAPMSIESPIAVASAAIEARDWDEARAALEPLLQNRLTQRVCTLMARIEGEQHGDKGRVREWLARAVNAPRDPAWTADGVVSDTWAAVSPVTGALDAFQWRVPVESAQKADPDGIAAKLEELVALGASREVVTTPATVVEAPPPAQSAPRGKPAAEAGAIEVIEAEPITMVPVKPSLAPHHQLPGAEASREVRIAEPKQPAGGMEAPVAMAARAAAQPVKSGTPREPTKESADNGGPAARAPGKASVFVAPRAPDDPGPEAVEAGDKRSAARPMSGH